MPQDSKFSAPKGEQSASRQDDMGTPDMIQVQRTNNKVDSQQLEHISSTGEEIMIKQVEQQQFHQHVAEMEADSNG